MTDDDKALAQRVRERGEHPGRSELPMGKDLCQAANRIEALSAEVEQARMEERAAIVAWLRERSTYDVYNLADLIEAGSHLDEQH